MSRKLEMGIELKNGLRVHGGRKRILRDSLFKKIGLSFHGNLFHERKRIRFVVQFPIPELEEQTVGAESDVLSHASLVHSNQFHGQAFTDELFFNQNRLMNNLVSLHLRNFVLDVLGVQHNRELRVQTLIPRDPLIALS